MISWLPLSAGLLPVALAASAADWRSRSVYQILTDRFALADGSSPSCSNLNDYCGGTWQGIINKLDYIQNMGFTAIWISPVTEQVQGLTNDGNSYHGYWQKNLYGLNSKFGTADDLKNLASELHDRGMYLMVDIVVNHFAYEGSHSSVDYSTFNPFNSASYFHDYCAIDYNDATSEKIVSTAYVHFRHLKHVN
jgi:alpha-amylase